MGFKQRAGLAVRGPRAEISRERVAPLLALAKQRRGCAAERVLFTCVSDVVKYYWCGLMAVLDARAPRREQTLFGVYLRDRLRLAVDAGRIRAVPVDDGELLDVCAEFSNTDAPAAAWRPARLDTPGGWDGLRERMELTRAAGLKSGWRVTGTQAESYLARRLPRARWHFEWQDYLLVCEPDGIADDYVYEFKNVDRLDRISERAPRAVLQAQMGAYFFGRSAVEVELAGLDKQQTVLRKAGAGVDAVLEVLRKFSAAERGELMPRPPRPFKCRSCDYLGTPACEISPLGR